MPQPKWLDEWFKNLYNQATYSCCLLAITITYTFFLFQIDTWGPLIAILFSPVNGLTLVATVICLIRLLPAPHITVNLVGHMVDMSGEDEDEDEAQHKPH